MAYEKNRNEQEYSIEKKKESLRGNMTTVLSCVRGLQEEKVLSCSFLPKTGKKSAQIEVGVTKENFPAVVTMKP